MGNPAGVKRDFDELEQRRLQAYSLLKAGLSDAEVARQLGVHRQSVGRWKKQIAEQGRGGLKKTGRAGRKSRLSEADVKKIERKLKEGPETLGYETGLWTLQRVAELIKRGVRSEVPSGACLVAVGENGLELPAAHGSCA